MTITLQYFESCPNWKVAESLVKSILEEHGLGVDLEYQLIEPTEEAEKYQFAGSPTLLIDGHDPFASDLAPIGLACRTYTTAAGPAESPTIEQIEEGLGVYG